MAIAKGVSLGPYEILNRIGEGGMGEVWRARDGRIGRDVAVKILPESFTHGDERILRFEQEARAAGALNHPGLVTIFDVGTIDGSPYIVMELLEGETLRDAIGDAFPVALPLRKALDYATQIASALAVAHEKGIIHRDLKPENLFVTSDKRVKILDFGLAKLAADATDVDGKHRTAKHLTSAGIAVGTPGYMSPEQVRAQPIDHRTDIFSFGSVVYEMVTGRPAFECFSAVETMHAVMNVEPPALPTLVPNIPPALDAIVLHCLEKNPRERFQSTRDLAFQLRMLLPDVENRTTNVREAPQRAPKRWPYRAAIAGTAAVLALAIGGWALFHRNEEAQVSPRAFKQLTFGEGLETFPTLSPDAKSFAYVSSQSGNRDIYVQRVDGRAAINITSDSPDADSEPAFSPDGSQIAFRSERDGGGIFVMGVTGESVRRLTDFGHNPSWSPDGTRIVAATEGVELQPRTRAERGSELWIIETQTGARRPLLQAVAGSPGYGTASDAVQPSWSPDGKRIAFWGLSDSFGSRDLWTIDPAAPQPKQTVIQVMSDRALDWNPAWSPDGKYLYFGSDRDGTMNLWRIALDEKTGKPAGAPEPMSLPAAFTGHFSVSAAGQIAYATITRSYRVVATPFDAATAKTGEPRTVMEGSVEALSFDPSPDGKSIAFTTGGAQEDLFLVDAGGKHLRQLTNDAARDRGVVWSPSGKTLFLYANRSGAYHVWSIGADGGGLTRITNDLDLQGTGAQNLFSPDVSPDGRTLAVQTETFAGLIHLAAPQGRRFEKLGGTTDNARTAGFPSWSPDGKRLVLMRRTPDGGLSSGFLVYSLATRQYQPILDRGTAPQWLPDGRRVAFFESDSIGVIDVDSYHLTTSPFTPLPGMRDAKTVYPRLSKDGSTLYMRQTLEQGDIWMLQPGDK